ncbi:hypothetical protein DTO271G3_4362 [Paecilomyces variotii]|nr:hypothetical protein DTO271G3_4362 [Paecilomyces variotii]
MSTLRVLCREQPDRTIALVTSEHALIFRHTPTAGESSNGIPEAGNETPRCLVEFCSASSINLREYRLLGEGHGTLGLITLNHDVFICVATASSKAATVRPGETVLRIDNVEFYCLNRSDYENGLEYESGSQWGAEEPSRSFSQDPRDVVTDHPFLALKKLLNDGSFYYSLDFNLTDRLQDRYNESTAFDIDSLDEDMLWNHYMINPLLLFRSRLASHERVALDASRILTSVIRGFAGTLTIPASAHPLPQVRSNLPSTLTLISRQSWRRAGTRFNSRGIDDDGNVSNFVETELILWSPPGINFSYVQVRGSVPIFWEQTPGLLPGQQKIEVTRSFEATQHAFDKHFEFLEHEYGAVHVVNLLSALKSGEAELSAKFREHISRSSLRQRGDPGSSSDHHLLRATEFDFHVEARGPAGYDVGRQIRVEVENSLDGFAYFLSEDVFRQSESPTNEKHYPKSSAVVIQQEGVFRTNCLDCLDRTNLVQTIISLMALDTFLIQHGGRVTQDLQMRHSSLWADNGDALSKIYAGTGALKSSFTRHGKMSLAGALADARKSATRLYVNNFTDKARQNTIDLLLGRLTNQLSVHLYDPISDMVTAEMNRQLTEYSSTKSIRIWVGTFNLNGRSEGASTDLSPWLSSAFDEHGEGPAIVAVGFQEIVELSPQQIMSTDPRTRKVWEEAVKVCLNDLASRQGPLRYVLLRSGQLVGAALLIYVRTDALSDIKNVEGSVKKTGLSGMGGNKGGCAIRFEYSNTRMCFVTAHLAAGFANYDERNRDYETISHGLRFQRNRSIEDHDTIIWLGDFNYRIGLSDHKVREYIKLGMFDKLYENDQLNLQMMAGRTFKFYSEAPITFPPTYKYDIGSDEYDTSEKARIPAWCDRVLWKGTNLRQSRYATADLRFSDHRPVWAMFDCTIHVIDEKLKERLSRSLYEKFKHGTDDLIPDLGRSADTEGGEELIPISPDLPSPSSDRQKWWLEPLGVPSRSTIKPPADGQIPNIYQKSNPFSSDGIPDWIYPSELPLRKKDDSTSLSTSGKKSTPPAPPAPRRQGRQAALQTELDGLERHDIDASKSPENNNLARSEELKAPPPIPRKPASLASSTSFEKDTNSISNLSLSSGGANRSAELQGRKPAIPARGVEGFESKNPSPRADVPPGLPIRNNGTSRDALADNLLDNDADDMSGWKPLVPKR